jgi:hypothetical protein
MRGVNAERDEDGGAERQEHHIHRKLRSAAENGRFHIRVRDGTGTRRIKKT